MTAAGESADVATVDPEKGPEAVMLDLMNPAVTLGRLG